MVRGSQCWMTQLHADTPVGPAALWCEGIEARQARSVRAGVPLHAPRQGLLCKAQRAARR